MKNPKSLLTVCLFLLLFSCRKKEPFPTNTAPGIHVSLDTRLKPYYSFSNDSYWLFSDSTGQVVDSLYLKDFRTTIDSLRGPAPQEQLATYEAVHYTLMGSKESFFVTATGKEIRIFRMYQSTKYTFLYYALNAEVCSSSMPGKNCRAEKDSLILKNGALFTNCSLSFYRSDIPEPISPVVSTESAWVANIGVVRIRSLISPTSHLELLRYSVKPR